MQLVTVEEPRRFAQIWPSGATGEWVVREGTLGRVGRIRETGLSPQSTPLNELAAPYFARGFVEVDPTSYAWVVVQFPTRNSTADRRLIEHAGNWLDSTLDERGLGYLDGHDRGKRASDGKIVVNMYARVKDGELGAEAAMAALRKGRADATRATIAYRDSNESEWVVRYERSSAKLPGQFSI